MKYLHRGILLSTFILFTFLGISLYGTYRSALQTRTFIKEKELPAVGLAVSARLDKAAYRYKKIGEELLEGDVLRNWILSGEKDLDKVVMFMRKVRDRYDLIDASLVSDITEKYYNTDYTVLQLSPENEKRDGWYYLYRESIDGSNIDSWTFEESGLTQVFVNVPILDHNGTYIGVTGAGIHSDEVKEVIASFEKEYGVRIELARKDGKVIYTTDKRVGRYLSERTLDTLIRNQTEAMGTVFEGGGDTSSLFWGTYLSDWNSYLLVEKQGGKIAQDMRTSMLKSFLPLGGLALLLFLISIFTVRFTFKVMKASLEKKEKKLTLQETGLRVAARYVRMLDTKDEYEEAVKRMLLWAAGSSNYSRSGKEDSGSNELNSDKTSPSEGDTYAVVNRSGKTSPEELLDPVFLGISSRAQKYTISLHWKLDASGIVLDRDEAFALELGVRELCRHIFEIAVPGIIIPIAGGAAEEGYTIEFASNIHGDYFSSEILEELRALLSVFGITLSTESTSQGMMDLLIHIPRQDR